MILPQKTKALKRQGTELKKLEKGIDRQIDKAG